MPGTFAPASVAYGLEDVLVAAYNKSTNTYSTPVALAAGQMLEVSFDNVQDELWGYNTITELLSVTTGATLKFGYGGLHRDALNVVCGTTTTSSGTSPNEVYTTDLTAGGSGLPYFGVIGVAPTTNSGKIVLGLRCCMLNSYPTYTFTGTEPEFFTNEVEGKAATVTVSTVQYLGRVKNYTTGSGWTAPASGANFLAFFA